MHSTIKSLISAEWAQLESISIILIQEKWFKKKYDNCTLQAKNVQFVTFNENALHKFNHTRLCTSQTMHSKHKDFVGVCFKVTWICNSNFSDVVLLSDFTLYIIFTFNKILSEATRQYYLLLSPFCAITPTKDDVNIRNIPIAIMLACNN